MISITEAECKSIMMEILSDIDVFCRKHNLRYSLAFGTLIGAVRHKGFIPWDDDIDIMMPRPDYDTFLKSYNGHHKQFECIYCCKTDEVYCTKTFAKVHDRNTIVIEQNTDSNDKYGVFVDVFPIDGVPNTVWGFKLQCAFYHLIASMMRIRNVRFSCLSSFSSKVKKILGMIIPISLLRHLNTAILSAVNYNSAKDIGVLCLENDTKKRQPQKTFEEYTTITFEGKEFMSIRDYDSNLAHYYGNYMRIPPVEQQINHSIQAFRKN